MVVSEIGVRQSGCLSVIFALFEEAGQAGTTGSVGTVIVIIRRTQEEQLTSRCQAVLKANHATNWSLCVCYFSCHRQLSYVQQN